MTIDRPPPQRHRAPAGHAHPAPPAHRRQALADHQRDRRSRRLAGARTLAALLEHEIAERAQRRIARHLLEARLPPGKTLDGFDFAAVSSLSKARVVALAEGDAWLAQGTNILLFGPPGVGKSHLAAPSATR